MRHPVAIAAAALVAGAVMVIAAVARLDAAGGSEGRATERTSLAVIVNRANPVSSVSLNELRSIFLGRKTTWEHGRRITVVLREPGQPERHAALSTLYGMTEPELTRHLLHLTFTGETAGAPRTLSSALGVRRFVVNVPGAIGLVAVGDVDASIKTLKIDGLAPSDPGYPLTLDRP